ncbi:DUF5685 family protein [Feifania hominis]|uniref:Uncharacterized protein n=1 Tax=Feifania hominis TaxID=2763660 RepID=A0A926DCW3_9FIRM|nr:hypothetical protein [Feifania hominis]
MFGYVVAQKSELRMCEYDVYQSHYCGICKQLGKEFGYFSNFSLSYDTVFLAVLGAALDEAEKPLCVRRCKANPLKKKACVVETPAVHYAANIHVLLTYHKLVDDKLDERGVKRLLARLYLVFMGRARKKALREYGDIDARIAADLRELDEAIATPGAPLDQYADSFAKVLRDCFVPLSEDDGDRRALAQLGYHMGRWIYLIDAFDDLEQDVQTGAFNPLLRYYDFVKGENIIDFKQRIMSNITVALTDSLAFASSAYELLNLKWYKGILDNILYRGLPERQKSILTKKVESTR